MSIQNTITEAIQGDTRACGLLATKCKNMALAYLKYKVKNGETSITNFSISLDDLAWDCIAEIFRRDANLHLEVLKDYFSEVNLEPEMASEEEFNASLRRLVFTKVNDEIFKNYGNHDPSLRKIIRNIKLAIKNKAGQELQIVSGDMIAFGTRDDRGGKPQMPPEILEIRLFYRVDTKMLIPEIIVAAQDVFMTQSEYDRTFPLTRLAIVIRKIYAKLHDRLLPESVTEKKLFLNGKLKKLIDDSVQKCKSQLFSSYVEKNKLEESIYNHYFEAVESILVDQFVEKNPKAFTYYEHLAQFLPELKKENYRENHRQYVEYFVQNAREEFIAILREDI